MNKILKKINRIPFKITLNHYFKFDEYTAKLTDGKLNSALSWDTLRQNHPHFSIPEDRNEWVKINENNIKKDGQDGGLIKRATEVAQLIREKKISHMFSAGVGGAGLEYFIKKNIPDLKITCSEYSEYNVKTLKKVFVEAEDVIKFDMKKDDWKIVMDNKDAKKQMVLLYRIDIDLNNEEMASMFKKMHEAGVENILIILCGILTLKGIHNRLKQRLSWILSRTKYSFAGYLRSEKKYLSFWTDYYKSEELELAGMKSFLLKRKS